MGHDRVKVLFDTDIGSDIDDAVALAYLLRQDRCELLGVTTVTGEADQRAEMVSAICRHAGRDDVPIHAGCTEAILVPLRQKQAQQARALGEWDRRRGFPPGEGVEFLRRTIRAHPGEITLLATGPMTNVGVLLAVDPQIPSLLKQLVLMCGHFFTEGGGEFNAVSDPHATAIVYGAGVRTQPPRHASFGLDVTKQCFLPAEECRKRLTADVLAPVRDFAEVWFQKRDRITFHDPLAAACVFQPDLCRYRAGRVTVSLDPETMGRTIFREEDAGPHSVAQEVAPDAFFDHYFDVVG